MSKHGRYRRQFRPEYSRLHQDHDLFWVVPFRVRYILAVVGRRYAGTSSVLTYLGEKRNFETYTLTNTLRELALRRGIPLEPRSSLQDFGNQIRAESGDAGYLARETLRKIRREHLSHRVASQSPARIAVGGFKNPAELDVFLKVRHFQVVVVDALDQCRFERARDTGMLKAELAPFQRSDEPLEENLDNFLKYIDRRDRGQQSEVGEPAASDPEWVGGFGQQVDATIARSPDAQTIDNNVTALPELYGRVNEQMDGLDKRFRTSID